MSAINYTFREFYIPERMMGGIRRYIEHGIHPGDFLTAVICNNLSDAAGRADEENLRNLPAYAAYFYNEADMRCWKSEENMKAWIEMHRLGRIQEKYGADYKNCDTCNQEITSEQYEEGKGLCPVCIDSIN